MCFSTCMVAALMTSTLFSGERDIDPAAVLAGANPVRPFADLDVFHLQGLWIDDQFLQQQPSAAPVSWEHARLLASWETTIGGAPAQAYAMRRGDSILLQFRIDEVIFFRNPEVRHAVEKNGNFHFNAENTRVLAVPIKHAGLILVGPEDAMPCTEQLLFKPI